MKRFACTAVLLLSSLPCLAEPAWRVVADATGGPVAGARVTLRPYHGASPVVVATDATGLVPVPSSLEGSYVIEVRARGFGAASTGPHTFSRQIRGLAGGEIRLLPEAVVRGSVTAFGGPLPGARVSVGSTQVRADAHGKFEARGLAPGRLWLWADAKGHLGKGQELHVAAGELREVAVELVAQQSLSARVVMPDGRPFPGISAYTSGGPSYGHAVSGSDGRFTIRGLHPGAYALQLHGEGIDTVRVDGFATATANRDVVLEPLPPRVHLSLGRNVFPAGEPVSVGLRTFRVDRVKLEVHAIARERLFDAAGRLQPPQAPRRDDRLVIRKELPVTYRRPYSFRHQEVPLPITEPGAYLVTVDGPGGPQTAPLLVSDLGLVVKRAPEEVMAWAIHLGSGEPWPGAAIKLSGAAGLLASGTADGDGVFRAAVAPAESVTVTAVSGSQVASVSAPLAAEALGSLQAYVYTDRPVYRPGQDVFYKAILRRQSEDGHAVPAGETVSLRVRDAQGQVIHQAEAVLGAMGTTTGRLALPAEPPLGVYTIEVDLGEETGQGQFKVLEYRKPEFVVEVSTDRPTYGSGDTVRVEIRGRYHFGAPLAGVTAQWLAFATPFVEDAEGYGWGGEDYDAGYGQLLASDVATLGPDGTAVATFVVPQLSQNLRIALEAVVSDASNRSVTGRASAMATVGDFSLSVQSGSWVYAPGSSAGILARARTFDGEPVETSVEVTVTRRTYESGARGWRDVPVASRQVATDGDGVARLPLEALAEGYYTMVARARDGRGRTLSARGWFWVAGADFSGVTEQVGALEIVPDRRSYRPGDAVRAVVQGVPKDGSVLVTTERDGIRTATVRRARGTMLVVDVPLGSQDAPNVYLAASSVRGGTHHVHAVSLRVEAPERALVVEVHPDRETYRPGDTATVRLQVRESTGAPVAAEVSLGVVDEAIYGISEELAPDIHGFFHGPRPNRVATVYSFSERLLGGADKDARSRARRNFKDTAFWAPSLQTDPSGQAMVTFPWPDNLTTWRFTARAVTLGTAVGASRTKVLVTKELVSRIHAPRFLVDGDVARVDVVVNDRSGRPRRIEADLRAEGPVTLEAPGPRGLDVAAGGEGRAAWVVRSLGPGAVRFTATVRDHAAASARPEDNEDALELLLPVHAFGRPFTVAATGEVDDAGREVVLDVPAGAVPGSVKASVSLNPSVASAAFGSLDDFIGYPYGCAEQTMSRFLPTVIASHAARSMGASLGPKAAEVPRMVEQGTQKLYGYQHQDGGWGWWKDDETHPYMTAYVTWGLVNARRAGFPVDDARIERGLEATAAQLGAATDPNVKAFMLHALASAGRADRNAAVGLFAERAKLSDYGRGLLLGVLASLSERERAAALRQELEARADLGGARPGAESQAHWNADTWNEGWMRNPVEATAYVLKGMVAEGASSAMAAHAARWLVMNRRGTSWHSTKDSAAAVYALLDFTQASESAPDARVTVRVDGRKAHEAAFRGYGDLDRPPAALSISTAGPHRLSVERAGRGRVFFSARVSGVVAADAIAPEGSALRVERRYFVAEQVPDGPGRLRIERRPLSGPLPAGSLVQVELRVTASSRTEFVMVEDPLPAGFEVVAEPAPAAGECEECFDEGRPYDRRDERDEKIAFFRTDVPEGSFSITYLAKAEVPGRLRVLPTRVEAMYTPGVEGHGASEEIEVLP